MEKVLHKKAELLHFNFIDNNGEYITFCELFGENFSYIKNETTIIIRIDLEKNLKNFSADNMKYFLLFYKELKSITFNNEHIIKQLTTIISNKNFDYFLKLDIGLNKQKKYKLSFSSNMNAIKFNLNFIDNL